MLGMFSYRMLIFLSLSHPAGLNKHIASPATQNVHGMDGEDLTLNKTTFQYKKIIEMFVQFTHMNTESFSTTAAVPLKGKP